MCQKGVRFGGLWGPGSLPEVLDIQGKLVLNSTGRKSKQSFLDLFDDKDESVLKQVKASLVQPKKKKAKDEKEKSLSLTTSLEKPAVKRIQREILYNNTSKEVSKWNSVVYKNRIADQLIFPLPEGKKLSKKDSRTTEDFFLPMTPLELEMAKLLHGEGYVEQQRASIIGTKETDDDGETYVRTIEEALERHHESARLRALQSYEMAKAKRQGKIKSKKYHRLQRREKIRKQIKEFEELQKTDPDAALLKLEELDHARVEERMSLKHRNTSKWAKAQTVRAKYNRESRAELSEQLKISRELTKKIAESSEESDPDDIDLELPALVKSSLDNPWCLTGSLKDNDKVNLYYTGYKKFWDDVNERKDRERKRAELEEARLLKAEEQEKAKQKLEAKQAEAEDENEIPLPAPVAAPKKPKTKRKTKITVPLVPLVSAKDVPQEISVDDLDELLHIANLELKKKLTKVVKRLKEKRQPVIQKHNVLEVDNGATKRNQDGDAEEIRELITDDREINFEASTISNIDEVQQNLTIPNISTSKADNDDLKRKNLPASIIDPSHFLEIRKSSKFDMKESNLDLGDQDDNEILPEEGEEDDERGHLKMIAEAFEDEDLLNDFERRKAEEVEGGKPKEIDLTLPGWGEWGGKDCKPSNKKRRKFTKKLPAPRLRRDATLPHVILNDNINVKIREHQVKELPFPFTRVADYEKIVRAPIGRTWLPETAMKDLIAPKVITRLGESIQPITDELIVKPSSGRDRKTRTLTLVK